MSMDSADDLDYAESFLREEDLTDYCRPTCQSEGTCDMDDCELGGDCCGCPCHDRYEGEPS